MELLYINLILCLAEIISGEVWHFQSNSSFWTYGSVRKLLNTSIIAAEYEAESLLGCSGLCSRVSGVSTLYFEPDQGRCHCNTDHDVEAEDPSQPEVIYGILKTSVQYEKSENRDQRTTVLPYHPSCSSLHSEGFHHDGVYAIQVFEGLVIDTWCNMADGGWTVIQRRFDGSENFDRPLGDYIIGFGNKTGEYWMGLEFQRHLTKHGSQLRITLEAFPGIDPPVVTSTYSSFTIWSANYLSPYTITVDGFKGSCGDSLKFHNGSQFSACDTSDKYFCASLFGGGWWYRTAKCAEAALNGPYARGALIRWTTCYGHNIDSISSTLMEIK